ncbi:MAG: hypothetical protein A2487_04860 [Candidatus Raymondbacteria bacterium RifOxyC12_full_50_8]|nr:MAG: hypothetical protein A2350_20295 [Candidatus Raymondbacteria bacterium RifOxyB12_full_50_8]OGJ92348.1 MAG: hypothetical protein A2248_10360 [Candidatus Raymondbacteria bacterium RIFOXYA2_FULL_49_16]OGJ99329.1 MAG: hypothetical protein A2453_13420 [Candidatus Raymondbacteria bacterium RIFOXYC2_FULL_50_21]OGK00417.1 MAG: hypothetical protein A2487_04860 [Candidatus Raymondbacteria bacterium RifOxyC12_full_50_8]OGP39821.1 MAG: hypothetical protein A2324_10450 [Candidatus Raymondbacteria ba
MRRRHFDALYETYIGDCRRKINGTPQLLIFGYIAQKKALIRHLFNKVCVSVITHGKGFLHFKGKSYTIEAPCIIVEIPGIQYRYGPYGCWEETYFKYREHDTKKLIQRWNLMKANPPVWPVYNSSRVQEYLTVIRTIGQHPSMTGVADRIDRLAELILIESIWHEEFNVFDDIKKRIYQAEQYIRDNYSRDIDQQKLIQQYSFSRASFFYYWKQSFPLTPVKLINKLRLMKARDLLLETDVSIKTIALSVGFKDQLYFSRKFRELYKMAPHDLRKKRSSNIP